MSLHICGVCTRPLATVWYWDYKSTLPPQEQPRAKFQALQHAAKAKENDASMRQVTIMIAVVVLSLSSNAMYSSGLCGVPVLTPYSHGDVLSPTLPQTTLLTFFFLAHNPRHRNSKFNVALLPYCPISAAIYLKQTTHNYIYRDKVVTSISALLVAALHFTSTLKPSISW